MEKTPVRLGLTLICHSSLRGVVELLGDVFHALQTVQSLATLLKWLREDVLSVAGPDHATRGELFDFIVAELRLREPLCPHRIGPVVRALANQRDDLPAFAAQLDRDLAAQGRGVSGLGRSGPSGSARVRRNCSAATPIPTG